MNDALAAIFDHLPETPTSVIWHFHQHSDGRIVMIDPLRKMAFCHKHSGQCALIEVEHLKVLKDYR